MFFDVKTKTILFFLRNKIKISFMLLMLVFNQLY